MTADQVILASELSALERAQREVILASPGELARAMRAIDARVAAVPRWLIDLWLWVLNLIIVRGYRADTTVESYARTLRQFAEWVIARGLDYTNISLTQFDDWQKSLYIERGNSSGYRRRHLAGLRSFYSWRASRGYGRDCTADLRGPKRVIRAPRKYSRKQLRALFAASRHARTELVRQRDEVLLLTLLTTGLRREEIATLRIDQLELSDRAGVIRVEGKGAKERLIPIEGPVVQKLALWLEARSRLERVADETVFVTVATSGGAHVMSKGAVERTVQRIAKRAGLPTWGVHRFRVTFATQMYDDGVDIERIRILMGHESIETTRRYIVVSDRMNRVRLKAHRQHDVLGTRPEGFPLWAQELEGKGHGRI